MEGVNKTVPISVGGTSEKTAGATGNVGIISEQMRDQLTLVMQELLLKTHELAFEYSTLDCDTLMQCPLGKKARELFKAVKRLNELVRGFTEQLPKTPSSKSPEIA